MAKQASPKVLHTTGNRDFFVPMETFDMPMVNIVIGIWSLHNTSLVSLTATQLRDNAYSWVHQSLCPFPSEDTEKMQTTHADGQFPLQEQWCSLFLVEEYALLGSIIPLNEPQGFQELAESGFFSSEERTSPHSRSLYSWWYYINAYYSSYKIQVQYMRWGKMQRFVTSMPV